MAYKVIILYRLYMPSYFLGTFTEYPQLIRSKESVRKWTQQEMVCCVHASGIIQNFKEV